MVRMPVSLTSHPNRSVRPIIHFPPIVTRVDQRMRFAPVQHRIRRYFMRRFFVVLLLFAAFACASGPKFAERPKTIERPDIEVVQLSVPFFGSGSTASVPLDVEITNRASVPLSVRRVRVESAGMSEYALYPAERLFKEDIPPGQTKAFNISATAYTNIARLNPVEPLSIRATIDFETGDVRFREIVFQRLLQR